MKREIGKWFLDIAKYIVTAVILKELFGGFEEKSIVVSVATGTALFAFISGILILRDVDKNDRKDKKSNVETKAKDSASESEEINNIYMEVSASKQSSNKKRKKGKRK
ncbi:MAG: hypothetical protein IJ200_13025 [Prevotella sp.]|nr:hypothetical protein [Prevotella sp.]